MTDRIEAIRALEPDPEPIICGSHCEHPHDGINGPSGCCTKGHGPYLYYCEDCHEAWRAASPKRAAEISRLASRLAGVTLAPVAPDAEPGESDD